MAHTTVVVAVVVVVCSFLWSVECFVLESLFVMRLKLLDAFIISVLIVPLDFA